MKNLSPVCLFAYNRPNHIKLTLDALMGANLSEKTELYIFCDGPKENAKTEQLNLIAQVREIIKENRNFKNVILKFSDINKGLGKSIIEGVSFVLKEHESVIVLEDDHVVHQDFLEFMNYYLNNYRNEKRVMHIGSFSRNSYLQFLLPRVFFTRYMDCWGWATWRDRWGMLSLDYNLFSDYFSIEFNRNLYNFNKLDHHTYLEKNIDEISTWAVFWHSTIAIHNGLCLMPRFSYVNNIGNDGSGSNEVLKTKVIASNFIGKFKPKQIDVSESKLGEYYIKDAYAKRSKKRFNRIKSMFHDFFARARNFLIRPNKK